MTTILVTGATGTLGRQVAERLRTEGADVRGLSRRSPTYAVDLHDGKGLDAAVDGVDAIVHCATSPRGGDDRAARYLIDAAKRAGVPHLVHISIVGVDRVPDLGGPEVRELTDLAGAYLRATGRRRRVVPVRLAGKAYAGYRSGGHLCPDHAVGTVTFEEFLAGRHRRTG